MRVGLPGLPALEHPQALSLALALALVLALALALALALVLALALALAPPLALPTHSTAGAPSRSRAHQSSWWGRTRRSSRGRCGT